MPNFSQKACTFGYFQADVIYVIRPVEFVVYESSQIFCMVDHAKYLGTLIDNKLNWSYHINDVSLKIAKGAGLLAKIRHYAPSSILRSLYFSFINPYIDYNLLNWGMAPPTNLNSINSKIKKAVRIISFKDRFDPSAPLFKHLDILPLDKSIETKYIKFMWKLHNNYLPNSIIKNFRNNTRTNFSLSLSRLESLNQFILFEGPRLWNELPDYITDKPSLNSITKAYKYYIGYGNNNDNRSNNNGNGNNNNNNTNNVPILRRGRNNYGNLTNWTGNRMVRW